MYKQKPHSRETKICSAKKHFPVTSFLLTAKGYVSSFALTNATHNFSRPPQFVTGNKQAVNVVLSWTPVAAEHPRGSCSPGLSSSYSKRCQSSAQIISQRISLCQDLPVTYSHFPHIRGTENKISLPSYFTIKRTEGRPGCRYMK